MDQLGTLIGIAGKLGLPDLAARGAALAREAAAFAALVRENAARAKHVLADGDRAALDAIHADALREADRLDAKLAEAAKR